MTKGNTISISNLIAYFPFKKIRPKQLEVLQQISDAINTGYRHIVLEAPTGFGKSPVAVTFARTLGSSYFCSATKDLQSQYTRDFPFLRSIKGMGNFTCLVKEDFIYNKTYGCHECDIEGSKNANRINSCRHKSVDYGACRIKNSAHNHDHKKCSACTDERRGLDRRGFHDGCRYRTWKEDYEISDPNTPQEAIYICDATLNAYQDYSTEIDRENKTGWMHLLNIISPAAVRNRATFTPCGYYDQLNKGMIARHTIFNYANFLIFLRRKKLSTRNLLILDEGHQIENQVAEDIGVSISTKTLRKFAGYDNAELLELSTYGYDSSMSEWLELLDKIYEVLEDTIPLITADEVRIDAEQYQQRIGDTANAIREDLGNWVVSKIVDSKDEAHKLGHQQIIADNYKERRISRVIFKPLIIAPYCSDLLTCCSTTLIMSATILDIDTFCRNIGLDLDQVNFIEVGSDFPLENRPIYPLNVAHLNYASLQIPDIQRMIAAAIDVILCKHANDKGIIHTTSYEQVDFIRRFLSIVNRHRLISTDPEIPRDEIIAQHWLESNKGSVLISPSLHTGLDLKDDQSRFQILVKIPYPSKADIWIAKKLQVDSGSWYNWQTALKLIQACGRSIRSADDWAKTYILDSLFTQFIQRNKIPLWFREAIVYDNNILSGF
jgi:ATP-dependent DNA helicase DinG